jgi:outer membrane protein insertion porin family
LVKEPVVSAGFGLMYKHSIVRAELNVGMPIAAHKGDGVRKGLQIGLGLHFL